MSEMTLIDAAKAGDYAHADELIRNGADVNQQDEQGWTPLNFAAGKGDLALVKLLVESGADVFKTGRDMRTPYMIALASGSGSVAKYLSEIEDKRPGEKPPAPERKYCKAYRLGELRRFPGWSESRINWKDRNKSDGNSGEAFSDDKVVFINQDFTVTESMWHDENIIFNSIGADWKEFCVSTLKFKVPDNLDLIAATEARA